MTISVGGSYSLDPKTGEISLIERTLEVAEAVEVEAPAAAPVVPADTAPDAAPVTKRAGKTAPTEE